jgi:tetratricopeptide (TPR) repeat protein
MPRALTSPLLGLTAAGLLTVLSGCDAGPSRTETASATTTDSAAGTSEANKGTVPISSSSAAARRLYLEGRALSEQLRAHDGRALYGKAAAKDPTFAMAHYQLAANAATARDFFAHMKRAVALADSASEGERLMILALEAGGNADPAKAMRYQQELVARYPDDERAHFLLGNGYFGRQEYDRAIGEYRAALTLNPRFSPAYNLLGYSYRAVEQYTDAATAFRKYIELIPGDPNPYDSYAELLMKTGRFDESVAQYRRALSVDPHFSPSRVGIASNLMYQDRHDEAAAVMDELYQRARDDADRRTALFVKGVILVDAGRTGAALKAIEQEYALDARLADSANMSGDAQLIGNILLDAGRTDEAAGRFHQALELVERSSLSEAVKQDVRLADHYNRGRLSLAGGNLAAARSEAKSYADGAAARQNGVRIRQAHELAGAIALKEQRFDEALAELAQANQQDPQVMYWTALAWQGKGDPAKAKEYAADAANAHVLPLVAYAFVREEAAKMSRL